MLNLQVEDSGERTFLTYKGCEAEFHPEMINNELVEEISMLFVTGYYLLDKQYNHTVIQFVQKMKTLGVTIIFDPGALVSKINPTILLSMIELSDIVTPNEGELEKISNIFNLSRKNIPGWFFEKGIHYLIEKKGNLGVNVWDAKKRDELFIPSYQVESIDTSGAGDSFAGGLMFGIIQDYDMERNIKLASACGALTTTFMGPHRKFDLNDILRIAGELK